MKKYLNISFEEFVTEKLQYLNLSDKKTDNTIAQFDTSDAEDSKKLNQVRSTLLKKEIFLLLKTALETANSDRPELMAEQIISLFSSSIKVADAETLKELERILINGDNIYKFNLSNGINNSIDDIAKNYKKFFNADFFEKLFKKQLGVRPITGPGEGLLSIFTDLKFANHGDLQSVANESIEVKSKNGRVLPVAKYLFIETITKNIVELSDQYVTVDQTKYTNFYRKSKGGFTGKFVKDVVDYSNELIATLDSNAKKDYLKKLAYILRGHRSEGIPMNPQISSDEEKIITTIIEKQDYSAFIDFKALVDFNGYCLDDGFKYLLLAMYPKISKNQIDTKNSFLVIDFKNTSFNDLFKIFRKYVHVSGAAEWDTNATGITATSNKAKQYRV